MVRPRVGHRKCKRAIDAIDTTLFHLISYAEYDPKLRVGVNSRILLYLMCHTDPYLKMKIKPSNETNVGRMVTSDREGNARRELLTPVVAGNVGTL